MGTGDERMDEKPRHVVMTENATAGPMFFTVATIASPVALPSASSSIMRFWNWMAYSTPRPMRMGNTAMETMVIGTPVTPITPVV